MIGSHRVLEQVIGQSTGDEFVIDSINPVAGGCINTAFVLVGKDARRFFVKRNQLFRRSMFAAEAAGLRELARCDSILVPTPVAIHEHDSHCFLILDFIAMGGRPNNPRLGEAIARMHTQNQAYFGWHRDNTIGTTEQPNPATDNWPAFFREYRLLHQHALLQASGCSRSLLQSLKTLAANLDTFFEGHSPRPSLLHGDLWSGNWSFTRGGQPVLYDPAVYYGDHETDLAMMELFGGVGEEFFAAYTAILPIHAGYGLRRDLYNLYHILNHALLFGGGYVQQAEDRINRLLKQAA